MITIIDYGMGNLGSIANMIKKIGYQTEITRDTEKIKEAKKIILPGVGSFDQAIFNLKELELFDLIKYKADTEKIPTLGICLGMQLLTKSSEEGESSGLNLINAEVKRFKFQDVSKFKIPHMGWNFVDQKKEYSLFKDMYEDPRFYFVHSYHVVCNYADDILTTTEYGYPFISAFARDNIMGVQFHPEKSHKFGMKLLKNFIENF